METKMVNAESAEALANEAIKTYLDDCGCTTPTEFANALMKLTSLAGLSMCAAVGYGEGVRRMMATTKHIVKSDVGLPTASVMRN